MPLDPNEDAEISVGYNVGGTSGVLKLSASGGGTDNGTYNITALAGPPFVTLVVPTLTAGARALVRTRQPVLRATFATNGASIDTLATVLRWRGEVVTNLARHNKGLLEWEVDSTRWLAVGDSALVEVTACGTSGGCTTATRWAVLLNDQKPVLGFTGMALEALGRAFAAPFGPGLSLSGAEVEAGFSVPSYMSMGTARSAGLVYSTRQAYPRALVPVDLELPWPAGTPDQVKLVLLDGITRLDSVVLATPTCATGAVKRCRVTLQGDFSASSFSAPVRKWLTVEASVTSGAVTQTGSDSVEVVLVDRRTTRYGSGWWVQEVAQLVTAGSDQILVGPTGAANIYRGSGASYLPPPGVFTSLVTVGSTRELRPRGSTAKVVFDALGRLQASVDPNGNRDSVVYSGSTDQVLALVDPGGKQIQFAYDGSGNVATITDPGGRQSKVTISAGTNQLTGDSLSSPVTRGDRTTFVYQSYPGTSTAVIVKRIGVILDTTIVTYDSTFKRRPTQARLPLVKDETGASINPVIGYTAYERQGYHAVRSLDSVYVEIKNPRNNYTRSLLDRWGQARRSWDALGLLSKSVFDQDGLVLFTEGKNGDSSRVYFAYDAYRRLVKQYITRGGSIFRMDSLVYDAAHRVLKHVDPRNQATSVTYDANGNVLTSTDAAGFIARAVYRTDGLVDSAQAPGETKYRKFSYDATWKNLLQVLDEANEVAAKHAVDGFGRDTTVDQKYRVQVTGTTTMWQWRRTRVYYNAANQADSTVLFRSVNCQTCITTPPPWPLASDTTATDRVGQRYDRAGRDSVRLNARGKATLTLFDRLDRDLSRRPWTDSMAVKESMLYHAAGNRKKTITRRGDIITTNYDSRNRDTLTIIPGVGTLRKLFAGPLDQLTRLWYATPTDSIGAVNGEVRYGYDNRGRVVADTAYTGSSPRVTTYAYDTYERVNTVSDPLGTWSTRFDASRGYADTLITPLTDTVRVVLDGRGRVIQTLTHGTGQAFHRLIDWTSTGALSTLSHWVNGTWNAGNYDRIGELDLDPPGSGGAALGPVWTEKHGSAGALDSLQDTVRYDGWERVRYWRALGQHVHISSDSFNFDYAGNISSPGGAETYDVVTDRLTARTDAGTTRTYTYDRAGNATGTTNAGVTWAYGYDALNRLVSVRRAGTLIARYGYDVLGRRIAKRVYSAASGGTVAYLRFVYRGGDVNFETDSVGTVGWKYTWGPGTDELVAADSGGQHYYAVRDKLGSVRGLVKRDGTWMFSERFRPYGLSLATSGTRVPLRYRWTGREYDQETGWYFHRSRYYDPSARRFVQEDPLGHGGSGNLYAYVAGRPLEATDPSGMMMKESEPPEGTGGSGGGGGAGLAGIGDDLTEVFGSGAGWIPRAQAYARIAAWHEARRIQKLFAATGIEAPLTLTTGNYEHSSNTTIAMGRSEPHLFGVAGYSEMLKNFANTGLQAIHLNYKDTKWLEGLAFDPTPMPGKLEMMNATNWKFQGRGIDRLTGKEYWVAGSIEVFHDYYAGVMVEMLPNYDDGLGDTYGMRP